MLISWRPEQGPHQAAHLEGLQAIAPAQVALDPSPLQRLLHGVGGEHTKNHRNRSIASHRSDSLAGFRHHHIEMGCIATDHSAQGDQHLVAAAAGHLLRHDRELK